MRKSGNHRGSTNWIAAIKTFVVVILLALFAANSYSAAGGNNIFSAPGAVFTMTNAAEGNEIVRFRRSPDGTLSGGERFATGGLGSGSGLGNQESLIFGFNDRLLFVVNAGSDDISVFDIHGREIELVEKQSSGGRRPISLALHGRLLYVLNAGGAVGANDNITGFIVGFRGSLTPLPGSTRPLSAVSTSPAQISFSPDGDTLVVTEKDTNKITTYAIGLFGTPGPPIVQDSTGQTPFGFAFAERGHLIVSEAFGGAAGASAVSSYSLSRSSEIQNISASVPTTQTAACWVVITKDGDTAFVTNTGSNIVSSYAVNRTGSITLKQAVAATTGAAPIDMAISNNGRFLYVLNGGGGTIGQYRISPSGTLTELAAPAGGLPASAVGLVAR